MRAYARGGGEDEELWGDHRAGPRPRLRALSRPGDRPPAHGARGAARARLPGGGASTRSPATPSTWACRATTPLAKTLFAVDELSGFIAACALVRPTGIEGMKPKSVRKKLKQPSFAAEVDRDQVRRGVEELGVDSTSTSQFVIDAMAERADELGLTPRPQRLRETRLRRGRGQAVAHDLLRPWTSNRITGGGSLPAAARLRPLEQVVDGAEAVGDAVLAAVADEQHVDLARAPAAVRAGDRRPRRSTPARSSSPASQCAPWIAQGTTCSSRQKAARRSPAGS